jgi:hypothetical protein
MSSYVEKCPKPIPIGLQEFAYQCETVVFEPIHGSISIHAFVPHNGGKQPYPNTEKDSIHHYELKIGRFTQNSIEITLTKTFKDKSEDIYTTNTSFSDLVNSLFAGGPANVYKHEAPINNYPKEQP